VVRLDPTDAFAFCHRGVALTRKGDLAAALADYSKAIRLCPAYASAHYNRGLVHLVQGRLQESLADLTETIRLNPGFTKAYASRATCYHRLGDRAMADADRAMAEELTTGLVPAGG
jgi:tetratricopeptide (TPR) repeat protein